MENLRKVVLVVDDEVGMREMLTWLLGRDYDIAAAADGAEAVARISSGGVDIVVTDITMPRLGGFGVLEAAAETFPKTPTIVMTGFGTVEMAVEAMRRGASDVLLKPFDAQILADRIQETLADRPNRLTRA